MTADCTQKNKTDCRKLPAAAKRALQEARARREKRQYEPERPKELQGRKGPDPTRYGDWEKKGIAVDF